MPTVSLWVAIALGALQGVLEWLPVSSEGNVTLVLTVMFGLSAVDAVGLSLFLHAGTALAAGVYYRETVAELVGVAPGRAAPDRRTADRASPGTTDRPPAADRSAERRFLGVATLVSAGAGVAAYATLRSVVSAFTGGGFVALVGLLLVGTGLFQRYAAADALGLDRRGAPTLPDAVLVGVLQGVAVLPGVSRSGTTTGALLLRGYGATDAFRLSFLLSIPAALGAGGLAVVEAGGLPSVAPVPAAAALATSAVVGLATIRALLGLVDRLAFPLVCVGLGLVTLVGAGLFVV